MIFSSNRAIDRIYSRYRMIRFNTSLFTTNVDGERERRAQCAEKAPRLHGKMELDFFGEPVTFFGPERNQTRNAMAALDSFILCAVSKGLSCTGGGTEAGIYQKPMHSAALSWSEVLRFAAVWNQNGEGVKSAPMLAVVAVTPLLVQSGIAYLKHLDTLLTYTKHVSAGFPAIQLHELATIAVSQQNNSLLNEREIMHIQALDFMLQGQYTTALTTYLQILRKCPGDALALSLAMDLSCNLGDKKSAIRASGSVAAYWNERRGGFVRPAIPGHAMVASLMALGYAVGGRDEDAEQMAERAMNQGKNVCGALATWAQAHVFDARGRVSEGISACANFDGMHNYEGAGFLFFDSRLGGYGARFSLDREEKGRGKSKALRLYESSFDRILDYSGFSKGKAWERPVQQAPLSWKNDRRLLISQEAAAELSWLDKLLGKTKVSPEKNSIDMDLILKRINYPSTDVLDWEPSCEDVLTWLPPTPAILSDATLLLLRMTLNGTVSARNTRWDNLRNGWAAMLNIQDTHGDASILSFCPLYSVVASLLFPPLRTGGDQVGSGRLAEGLHMMGDMLVLGSPVSEAEKTTSIREVIADTGPDFWLPAENDIQEKWRKIVLHLASAIDGFGQDFHKEPSTYSHPSLRFKAWDFEARPILEHSVVYAACKAGDIDSLSLARSICSQGVSLRTQSPEEWWRYSIVLGLLGDEVGSEDALENSMNFGSGEGGQR